MVLFQSGLVSKLVQSPQYAGALLIFSLITLLFTYALQRLQQWFPLNPQGLGYQGPGYQVLGSQGGLGTSTHLLGRCLGR